MGVGVHFLTSGHFSSSDCSLKLPAVDCTEGMKHLNGTCYVDGDFQGIWNTTLFTNVTGRQRVSPSEEYWEYVYFLSYSLLLRFLDFPILGLHGASVYFWGRIVGVTVRGGG